MACKQHCAPLHGRAADLTGHLNGQIFHPTFEGRSQELRCQDAAALLPRNEPRRRKGCGGPSRSLRGEGPAAIFALPCQGVSTHPPGEFLFTHRVG